MDHDALALSFVIVSLALLVFTTNIVWLFALVASGLYLGWRIGQRIIPAGGHEV